MQCNNFLSQNIFTFWSTLEHLWMTITLNSFYQNGLSVTETLRVQNLPFHIEIFQNRYLGSFTERKIIFLNLLGMKYRVCS